jgi:protein-S-isoprenylcysteine O-methyltransferase Ste14
MNPLDDNDDAIDALLRKQFAGHVPDAGFTERVMQRLPARPRRSAWPLWAGVLTGATVCAFSLQSSPLLHAAWRDWTASELTVPVIALMITGASLALLASLWAVMEADDH